MPPSTRRADYGRYRELMAERPELFVSDTDGIRILSDEAEIAAARRLITRRNRAKGLPAASASIGVLAEDAYILALRDAVRFPDGSLGTYNRVIYDQAGGVAVLGLYRGDLVLIRIYRHALGRWLLEIPRGGVEHGRLAVDAARAEMAEEVGGAVTRLVPLGQIASDTALCNGTVDLFFAELSELGDPQASEAIGAIRRVSPAMFETLMAAGDIMDGNAIAAFALARRKGLLP